MGRQEYIDYDRAYYDLCLLCLGRTCARAVQPLLLPLPLTLTLTVCQGCAGASASGFAYGGALLTTPSPRLLELAVSPPAGEHATYGLLP